MLFLVMEKAAILKDLDEYGIREKMVDVAPGAAAIEELARFLREEYIEKVAEFAKRCGGRLHDEMGMNE